MVFDSMTGTGLGAVTTFVDGLDHPEGVTMGPDGALYAGGEGGQIYRIDVRDRKVEQIGDTGGFVLGLCCDAEGRVYSCDVGRREVLRLSEGNVEVYSSGSADVPMINPNWPLFDDSGNLFVTDSGRWKQNDGRIFRIDPTGHTEIWSAQSSGFPNGACLSREGDALLVLESTTPALVRIPILQDGTAGDRELIVELPGTIPDGLTLDTDGNAYICCYRPDRVLKVSTDGEVDVLADDPEGTALSAPTNAVWVGGDLVTGNLGRWHLSLIKVGAEGVSLRYPSVGGN